MRDASDENLLGDYLKQRRSKLDPASFGFSGARRRTPGLRREEVAQRANISPTWYTWLEQGRGGAPSADVLDRIARALMLTDTERDHLFVIGLGQLPAVRAASNEGVGPRLQRVLDALEPAAALIRTATWDVVAWNRAVAVVLTDYDAVPPSQRNILRQLFSDREHRDRLGEWKGVARFVVGAFRADAARAGDTQQVKDLVAELCRLSSEFESMWRDNDVSEPFGGLKHIRHPVLGSIAMEHSGFAVDGRPDLRMTVYNPVEAEDAETISAHIRERAHGPASLVPDRP